MEDSNFDLQDFKKERNKQSVKKQNNDRFYDVPPINNRNRTNYYIPEENVFDDRPSNHYQRYKEKTFQSKNSSHLQNNEVWQRNNQREDDDYYQNFKNPNLDATSRHMRECSQYGNINRSEINSFQSDHNSVQRQVRNDTKNTYFNGTARYPEHKVKHCGIADSVANRNGNIIQFKKSHNLRAHSSYQQYSGEGSSDLMTNSIQDKGCIPNSMYTNRSGFYRDKASHLDKKREITKKTSFVDKSKLDQREFLIHELSMNHYECMICMNVVKKEVSTWCCNKCYNIFHMHCIDKWARSGDKKENVEQGAIVWRCPGCQNENIDVNTNKLIYTCFCNKEVNPVYKIGTTPHSCGDVCARVSQLSSTCPHLCSIQCHPGPCPPCQASLTRACHCGQSRITARCNGDESQFQCALMCEQTMQCGLHQCNKPCHIDNGHQCDIIMEQQCWCGCVSMSILCGSSESQSKGYCCNNICKRKIDCGNHNCESHCHEGSCEPCLLMPNRVATCWCGKVDISKLSKKRRSCLDPIPSCSGLCDKIHTKCGHKCKEICHEGECGACPGIMSVKCLCQGTMSTIDCSSNELVQCKQKCKSKLLCGRHRCDKSCCVTEVHLCPLECGRMLKCKEHRCSLECGHSGLCPSCPNVSFDELFCSCGTTFALPPIACNQKPPNCSLPCSKSHSCDHEVRHRCHDNQKCPPCTELVTKPCPGGHSEYYHIPCFRPVATCGMACNKTLPHCGHLCTRLCHAGDCVEDGEPCKQPCKLPREACGHPCAAQCHTGDCNNVMTECEHAVTLHCQCRLRSSAFTCKQICSFQSEPALAVKNNLQSAPDSPGLTLSCDSACADALTVSKHLRAVYTSSSSTATSKFGLDTHLSCIQKCTTTCHNVPPQANICDKACNSSAYLSVQRYYSSFYEEFAKYNFKFVVAVENIFRDFYRVLSSREGGGQCVHLFQSISIEKSQFVHRFSSAFKLICLVSRNNDGTANVLIKGDIANYCCPKVLLTKKIEDKHLKGGSGSVKYAF